MTIEEALYARLVADAGLSALVGTRVYPEQAPQADTFPLVTYSEAQARKVRGLSATINLQQYDMHLDCYAASYSSAKAVRAAVVASLDAMQELAIGSGTVTVLGSFFESGESGHEAPIHADEMGIFRAGLDLSIHYRTN